MTDTLKEILFYLPSNSIVSLATVCKWNYILIKSALTDDFYVKRLAHHPEYQLLFTDIPRYDSFVYKSLVSRVIEMSNSLACVSRSSNMDQVETDQMHNIFPGELTIAVDLIDMTYPFFILKIYSLANMYSDDVLLNVCQIFQRITGDVPYIWDSDITNKTMKEVFLKKPVFFAKFICYCIIPNASLTKCIVAWIGTDYKPLERLLTHIELLGVYNISCRLAASVCSVVFDEINNKKYHQLINYLLRFMTGRRLRVTMKRKKVDKADSFKKLYEEVTSKYAYYQFPEIYSSNDYGDNFNNLSADYMEVIDWLSEEGLNKRIAVWKNGDDTISLVKNWIKSKRLGPLHFTIRSVFQILDLMLQISPLNNAEYHSLLTQAIFNLSAETIIRLLLDPRAKDYVPPNDREFVIDPDHSPHYDAILHTLSTNRVFDTQPLIDKLILSAVRARDLVMLENMKAYLKYANLNNIGEALVNEMIAESGDVFEVLEAGDFPISKKTQRGVANYITLPNADINSNVRHFRDNVERLIDDGRFDSVIKSGPLLITAVINSDYKLVKLLLNIGSDPMETEGLALERAADFQYDSTQALKVVKLLMKYPSVNTNKKLIKKAIKIARESKLKDVEKYLTKQLAKISL